MTTMITSGTHYILQKKTNLFTVYLLCCMPYANQIMCTGTYAEADLFDVYVNL